MWRAGELDPLIKRARSWAFARRERHVGRPPQKAIDLTEDFPPKLAQQVRDAVSSGKVGRASSMMRGADKPDGKPIRVDEAVEKKLRELHPPARPAMGPAPPRPPAPTGRFEEVDASFVWSLVTQLRGASGPSGLGTDALRILVRHPGSRLAETIALLIRRIAEEDLPRPVGSESPGRSGQEGWWSPPRWSWGGPPAAGWKGHRESLQE